MFWGADLSFLQMVIVWVIMLVLFGGSLHLALSIMRVEVEPIQEAVVVLTAMVIALFPVIGPLASTVLTIYLLYRMADEKLGALILTVILSGFLSRFFSGLLVVALTQLLR